MNDEDLAPLFNAGDFEGALTGAVNKAVSHAIRIINQETPIALSAAAKELPEQVVYVALIGRVEEWMEAHPKRRSERLSAATEVLKTVAMLLFAMREPRSEKRAKPEQVLFERLTMAMAVGEAATFLSAVESLDAAAGGIEGAKPKSPVTNLYEINANRSWWHAIAFEAWDKRQDEMARLPAGVQRPSANALHRWITKTVIVPEWKRRGAIESEKNKDWPNALKTALRRRRDMRAAVTTS